MRRWYQMQPTTRQIFIIAPDIEVKMLIMLARLADLT